MKENNSKSKSGKGFSEKAKDFFKEVFTKNIPIKILAIVLAAVMVILINL